MMNDPPIRRLTRSKSSDESPILRPPGEGAPCRPSSPPPSQIAAAPSYDEDPPPTTVTDIDSPSRSPRRRAPPRAASAAISGSRRAPLRAASAALPGRRAPPGRTTSGMGTTNNLSARGPLSRTLSRTHTGDGMQEMAAWRQEQLSSRCGGGGGPAPLVRTHSRITDLAKLREQQQLLQGAPLLNEEEASDMSEDSSVAEFRESDDESETIEDETSVGDLNEEDDEDEDDDDDEY